MENGDLADIVCLHFQEAFDSFFFFFFFKETKKLRDKKEGYGIGDMFKR